MAMGADFFCFCPMPLPHPQLDGYEICVIVVFFFIDLRFM